MDPLSTTNGPQTSIPPPSLTDGQKGIIFPVALQLKQRPHPNVGTYVQNWHPPSAIAARFGLPLQFGNWLSYSGAKKNDYATMFMLDIDPDSETFGLPKASPGHGDPRDRFYGDAVVIRTDGEDIDCYSEVLVIAEYIRIKILPLLAQFRKITTEASGMRAPWLELCLKRMTRGDLVRWFKGITALGRLECLRGEMVDMKTMRLIHKVPKKEKGKKKGAAMKDGRRDSVVVMR
ncbi:uncharacterized protein CLAFUR5_11819 [Fulvia fulva]|uniref:Uncharacterized protein n=1 Tax=Passalora fulva TaxID=5499 RepID=A0A9Q8UUH9_PASFU|nr:uncharacterized protein CLAFUR5_11819 [Fulvia fulva]KAK4627733.1 hypothetical protein CLAFUR0_05078 [Fulvia fulva]UJO22974.1 hypothetical protein CLAFUR5_11819 [Fulvia fulva]WPV29135.1 hypothetical protein CLAFUW7_05082 [Fulvia fulva]